MRYWSMIADTIAPVFVVICVMIIVVVYIVHSSKRKIAEASSIDRAYVEQLLQDILQDNMDIKAELADIQEKVSSIEKMMKEV
jgi:ABC-type multidrug transport system fused ATPase/permease subunit